MRLEGSFYELLETRETEGGFEADIRLIPDNVIFRAHFPEYPITPGAVQIRIATELFSVFCGCPVSLTGISRLKFVSPLFPGVEVTYSFTETSVTVRSGGKVFSSMMLEYSLL